MHIDVAERRFAALIERHQTIVRGIGNKGRHGDQQRHNRNAYQDYRQQHRLLSLEIAHKLSRQGCKIVEEYR